ncbi:P-loop containing nucleoside triphosphate hydrolase protein [Aureobasidium namibiae CBS 147.97]|uniref:p-loop containing nucleoside triphosphate hydrolase protein n=1 Tax=Aureobasidium namibiae CBS 147.97 TaxID=1043004 RepID=A0A074X252_9PEZI|nr:P-loop containing nucleoside triphosphate hydrolase protein [Aureobasidium namibiae CBS 147.97]KEQ68691.1 P-loop containing nucleoside triphosphate hydrolase protein [Aureobasidium namibiae CBS 147.97]
MEKQAEADKFQRWRAFRQADMLDAFKRMMGLDAEFRGVQFAILRALQEGHKNVLGIMPTGGGKSLTFMLLARCSPSGVTIVVVPLTALEGDMASIVFVTPEAAVGQAFKRFMQQKKLTGQLDRLVIDECHVVLDSRRKTADKDAWRPEILELYKTIEQLVQTLFLTATLPPRNELEFYDKMNINKHEIVKIRDSTTRKEIKYQVVDYEEEEEEEALQRMVDDKKR